MNSTLTPDQIAQWVWMREALPYQEIPALRKVYAATCREYNLGTGPNRYLQWRAFGESMAEIDWCLLRAKTEHLRRR